METQDEVLTWLATTSSQERFAFMRRALDCFPQSDYQGLMRLVEHSKQRKGRQAIQAKKQLKRKGVKKGAGVPERASALPVPSKKPREEAPWWEQYPEDKILALDCEMVSLKETINGKHPVKAATVAIVRKSDLKTVYKATVKHENGSFIVNNFTKAINGFEEDSLVKGTAFEEVKAEVHKIIKGSLVLTVNGGMDFTSLDLVISDYDVFDYHQHWNKFSGQITKCGEHVLQPIGLRSLYFHYFGIDIHAGSHSAESDARATAQLFDKYKIIKTTNLTSRSHFPTADEFSSIKTMK